jgi:hypothetical protein
MELMELSKTRMTPAGRRSGSKRHRGVEGAWLVRLAVVAVFAAAMFLVHPASARATEFEICRLAKELGYDIDKELPLIARMRSKRDLCTSRYWELYRPKPLEQVLDAADLARYHRAIEKGDCRRAAALIDDRFDAAHPDALPHRSDEFHQRSWRGRIAEHYVELGVCDSLQYIKWSLKKIDAAGIKARPFWGARENYFRSGSPYPAPVQNMYSGVAGLLYRLDHFKSPKVALALLRLSHEARAVKFHPHYELYLALRIRGMGVEDPLIDEIVSRPLDRAIRSRIVEMADGKSSSGIPRFPK